MNKTAIASLNPAASCPAWCTATHERDWITPRANGDWNVLHEGEVTTVHVNEQVAPGVTVDIAVNSESYACETHSHCHPRQLWVEAVDTYGNRQSFGLTARHAFRLMEVLAREAAAILAEETVPTVAAR